MGAVWGVVSGKFAITTAGLLLASRIDQRSLQAVITPHVAISAVASGFAERRHLIGADAGATSNHRPLSIGIGAEEFDLPRLGVFHGPLPSGAEMILGRDILSTHIFALDIPRCEISLLEPGEASRLRRRFVPAPLVMDADGELRLTVKINGVASEAEIRLDQTAPLALRAGLWQAAPPARDEQAQIEIGRVRLKVPFGWADSTVGDRVNLGLGAFGGRTIVLDLPHGILWISTSAADQ